MTREDLEEILPLIDEYQRFYGAEPQRGMNRLFFGQFVDHHVTGAQFAAFDDGGRAIGFATLYFLPSSLSARTYCVLNDLFTLPECRGRGVARKLIATAAHFAKERGFAALEWQTQQENVTAQRLYDRLGATRTAWYTYCLSCR